MSVPEQKYSFSEIEFMVFGLNLKPILYLVFNYLLLGF